MASVAPAEASAYMKSVLDLQRAQAKYLLRGRFIDDEGFVCTDPALLAKRFVAADGTSAVLVSISDAAFADCVSLVKLSLPESLESLGWEAFSGCRSLRDVVIPESVASVDWKAFSGCSSLENVVIMSGVAEIGLQAFEGCSSLKSVQIPETVSSIGDYAFAGCSAAVPPRHPAHTTCRKRESASHVCQRM